ncbi:Uncharacterised protein [uncultured archaeon]|nr:Uncharacterised protein [uncultured archaeon]
MPRQIKKSGINAKTPVIQVFSDKLTLMSTSNNAVTKKEVKAIGDKYLSLLCETANKTGFGIERIWDGKIYKINVAIPLELRGAYENYANLLEIKVDLEDINKDLRELDEAALVTKGSPNRKKFYMLGYLEGAFEGIQKAIKEMENSVRKKPKLLKK